MSRARDQANAYRELEAAVRRNSPAHRGLRRRQAARQLPDAVVAEAVAVEPAVAEPAVAEPAVVERIILEPLILEPADVAGEPAPEQLSPYATTASHTDPTPTETFAMALAGTPHKKRRGWLTWLIVLLIIVAAYLVAAVLLRNNLPEGTTIEGVPAGDTIGDATKITQELAAVAARATVTLTAGDNATTLDPASAGLSVDVDATVATAGGFTLDPAALWHRLRGDGTDHDVVVAVAEPAFTDAVNAAADDLDAVAADATVAIEGTEAVATDGSQAITVNRDAARDDILAQWPTKRPIELTAEVIDPAVTTAEAKGLAASLNGHVFAGPTTLTGENGDVILPAGQVAAYSSITSTDGTLAWAVDGASLSAFILDTYPWVENEPVDATYSFTKAHKLKVTTGQPGRVLDAEHVDDAVIAAGGTTARTAPIPYIETDPDVTAEEVPTQDFTARISHFRTPPTPEPVRTKNLVRAAQLITGTIVKPGKRFNLTDTIGPITAANGYFDAHVIVNGVLTTGIGGGLSQMATTTYNAGYFAGYDDITHRPHSVWFPRYPPGRESTVVNGQINVVYENTTPYAMIMNSYVSGGYLNVDIWSTPYYTVKTKASPKTNIVRPHVVESSASDCESKPNGEAGFKITNTRWVYLGDELTEKRSWTWTYNPDNGIRCVG